MKLYNSLTRKLEILKPINPPNVSLYTCGPTVYDYTHIGHMRAYLINDLLRRTLNYCGLNVNHVMNITDVGHLSGDDDSGEDKMEKGAKKYGKTVWDVAKFYTEFFFKTTDALNILRPNIICKATEHVPDMIQLISKLNQNGFVYDTAEAVYFNVMKFKNYGKLSGQKLDDKIQASREEVIVDPGKKHPADFALWLKRVGRFADHTMYWPSPWGDGFPGWHIECSAMSMKYLGESIDIHTGGIDHIPVHHENEIAQSECANGVPFVHYWMHFYFLLVDGKKMSKSLGNFFTIDDLIKKKVDPLALRYLFLQSHYRQTMNFTCGSVQAAGEALKKLKQIVAQLKNEASDNNNNDPRADIFEKRFNDAINQDLQTPQAIAIMWEILKSDLVAQEKLKLLFSFDEVLGLKLSDIKKLSFPKEILILAEKRKQAKANKDFAASDTIRKQIEEKGYVIEDSKDGYTIK